jgi:hypothetical protein
MRTASHCAALALSLAFGSGCGFGQRTYPVHGTVLFEDDTPAAQLAGGTVVFESLDDKSNATATIQADGTFRLRGQDGRDGVPAGKYRVLIVPPEPDDPDRRPPPIIADRYLSFDTSGLETSVHEKPNELQLKVQRAGTSGR